MAKPYSIRTDREFMLAWNAMSSFKKAQDILSLLNKSIEAGKHPVSMSLFGAICGYYAAPFMSSNNLGCLPAKNLISARNKKLHESMLKLRNEVFMHLDADVELFGVKYATNPRIIVWQDKTITIEAKSWLPNGFKLIEIETLLRKLVELLHGHALEYIKNKLQGMDLPPGEYVVVTERGSLKLNACREHGG